MAPTLALAILDQLVGQLIDRHFGVPLRHRLAQRRPPTAELLDVAGEQEQMGSGASDLGQRGERGAPAVDGSGNRQREQRRILPRRPPGLRHIADPPDQPDGIGCGSAEYNFGIVAGQFLRVGVIRPASGAQRQEPVEPGLLVHRERVTARGIGDLSRVGRFALGGPPSADQAEWVHGGFLSLARRRRGRVCCDRCRNRTCNAPDNRPHPAHVAPLCCCRADDVSV
jgi:hypothetical protein